MRPPRFFTRLRKGKIGPGFIAGGADNDPAGIITYTTAGALFGYALLWVILITTPMLIVIQEMASRLAIVKKKGLSKIISEFYGKRIALGAISALLLANIITIGADLAGMAAVLGMLTGWNWFIFVVPIALFLILFIAYERYRTIRTFLMGLSLLLIVYIFSSLLAKPNWAAVVEGFVPFYRHSFIFVAAALGVIGTTISPYMLFWQSSDELEEHQRRPKGIGTETTLGMVWSNVIAAFIIIAAASTLFIAGISVDSPEQAALALKPLAGHWAYLLFSIGIIISGFLALPVLASSSAYALSEFFGWKEGLDKYPKKAKGFYFVFTASILIGTLLALLPINPIHFLFYSQVLNGVLMPVLVLILLLLCNNKKIMGRYINRPIQNIFAIFLLAILLILDFLLLFHLL